MSKHKSIFENPILSTKVKSARAKIFPEGGLGYFIGPTLALLTNSVLSSYFNKYLTDVLNMNVWASWFVTWLPVVSVIFVVLGNILVGRLMDRNRTKAGKGCTPPCPPDSAENVPQVPWTYSTSLTAKTSYLYFFPSPRRAHLFPSQDVPWRIRLYGDCMASLLCFLY